MVQEVKILEGLGGLDEKSKWPGLGSKNMAQVRTVKLVLADGGCARLIEANLKQMKS